MKKKLSIIVVTTDRMHLVERLLYSLSQQSCKDFEVLLVHGPQVHERESAMLCARFPELCVRTFQSRDLCLSRSRNLALAHMEGEFFSLADDDCLYAPDTVQNVLEAFARHGNIHGFMGRHIGLDEAFSPGTDVPKLLGRRAVFSRCPSYLHFYRTEVLDQAGYFDEELGVGCSPLYQSGEETDFALRVLKAGFVLARLSSVVVFHPHENLRSPNLATKVRKYAAGRMRLLHKHGFPRYFILGNVVYPLLALPVDCARSCLALARYRWLMFVSRLRYMRER